MFLAYVKDTLGITPTFECLKSEDMIQGFVQTLVQKRIQGSIIALGRMREKFRRQCIQLHTRAGKLWRLKRKGLNGQ